MKNKKVVKLGILGLGVVGSELVAQIKKNQNKIRLETDVCLEIEKIYVRTLRKNRTIETSGLPLTTNIDDIIENPSIDIICECMGGNGFKATGDFVLKAMKNGKHAIMSSKKALAKFAPSFLETANTYNVHLKYDASVGGGIPIAKVLEHTFKGDKILKIMGIFNATSNYIYSKMFRENLSFDSALQLAQSKGYAENDPSDDVDGYDALYKLTILTMFGMKKILEPSCVTPDSFSRVNIKDMQYACDLGYAIKPMALVKSINGTFEYKVGPCLVPSDHVAANTFNNNNAIIIEGENCGELAFYGQGAGAKPTANAMFDDLMNIITSGKPANLLPVSKICANNLVKFHSRLYWRFTVKHNNLLPTISAIFTENKTKIENLIQKEQPDKQETDVAVLTNNTDSAGIENILNRTGNVGILNNSLFAVV